MVTACPVCGEAYPVGTPERCICGHDFVTGDPAAAIARYTDEKRAGNRWWLGGLAAMFFLPVTLLFAGDGAVRSLLVLFHTAFVGIAVIGGLVRADRAEKKLKAAQELKQLPAARVVKAP